MAGRHRRLDTSLQGWERAIKSFVAALERGRSPPFTAAISSWFDRESDGRAVWVLLALFVASWTSFQVIVFSAIGLNDDLTEVFVWSRHPSLGFAKHPPLAGLMGTVWFSVFPATNWSFDLLAMLNSAVALFAVDLIARRYVKGDKRLLVLLLLLLTPFYQFNGQRFSANTPLLSTWPIATYCFLRAFETRGALWSAAAGASAALAMLGKYYSIYLIGALVIAALSHPRRWSYLRSSSPWISILTATVVLAPHLYWLTTTGFETVHFAAAQHRSDSTSDELRAVLAYLIGGLGYALLPSVVFAAAVRADRHALRPIFWPQDADRRMLVVLLGGQLLLPAVTAPFIGVNLTPLWTMSAWFLLPIVLLSPAQITLTRRAAVRVAAGVAIMTAVVLAAAPVVAWTNYASGIDNGRAYYAIVAEELTRTWRTAMGRPLTIVTGDLSLAQAASFYSPDHPDSTAYFGSSEAPWVTNDRLQREGWAVICQSANQFCIDRAGVDSAARPGVERLEKTLTVSFFGLSSAEKTFVFILVPPGAGKP